jgi:hypothetical protein
MSLGTILLIILVIVLLGGFSGFGGGPFYGTGYYGGGGLGLILVIVLILVLLGKFWTARTVPKGPRVVISVIIYAAELAVAAIILFYVVEILTMPVNMKRVCQGLIVLIAILSVIGVLLGSAPPPASHVGPLSPNSPSNPSIVRWRNHLSALSDHLGGLVCAFAAALNERRISGSREYPNRNATSE